MKSTFRIYVALLILALTITGIVYVSCSKDNSATPGTGTGTGTTHFNLYMTDTPGPYQQVNVNIVGAMVHSDVSGWMTLNIRPGIYNLLNLINGKDTLIADGFVTVGMVSQVRLILGPTGNTVMVNNTLYTLQTPSDQQSGLKLTINSMLSAGITYNLILDFDAGASVVQTGNGSYILKPVIRAIVTASSGAIQGIISPASLAQITASSSSTTNANTFSSSATGAFLLQGLTAGSYEVTVTPLPPYVTQTFNNIIVNTGQVTNMGTIVLH